MAVEHDLQRRRPLRKTQQQVLLNARLSRGFTETVFLVDEVDGDFVSAVREQPEATERPELDKVFR